MTLWYVRWVEDKHRQRQWFDTEAAALAFASIKTGSVIGSYTPTLES